SNLPTSTGVTPLMIAAASGDVDTIQKLLDRGAEVSATEKNYGQTPLIFAAAYNRPEAIAVLIRAGAKTSQATKTRAPGGGGGAPRGGNAGAARGGRGAVPPNSPAQNRGGTAATNTAPP